MDRIHGSIIDDMVKRLPKSSLLHDKSTHTRVFILEWLMEKQCFTAQKVMEV